MIISALVEEDTRADTICTFTPKDHPDLVAELNAFSVEDTHRLSNNYKDLTFNDYPFVTVWKKCDEITGYSTGWSRDFYPKGSIRLLNRFYIAPAERHNVSTKLLLPSTHVTIDQQIGFAELLGYNYMFISREPRAPKHFEMFIMELNFRSVREWEYNLGPFLVAPDPSNSECWQSLAVVTTGIQDPDDFWAKWKKK